MDPPLAARLPLEVLDGIRQVDAASLDAGQLEDLVEDASGRPHERTSLLVLLVARLLPDEHHLSRRPAFAEDRLGARLPERARAAARRRLAEPGERRPLGKVRSG